MARDTLNKNFGEAFEKARNKFKGFVDSRGIPIVVLYTLHVKDITVAAVKGYDIVIEAIERDYGKEIAKPFKKVNTKAHWDTLIREVISDIKKNKKIIGNVGGTTIKPWSSMKRKVPKPGTYFGQKRGGTVSTRLVLYMFGSSTSGITDGYIRRIAQHVSNELWQKICSSPKLNKERQRKLTEYRLTSRKPEAGTRTAKSKFTQAFATEHDPNKTMAMEGLQLLQQNAIAGTTAPVFKYGSMQFLQTDLYAHVMNTVKADWGQKKTKKKIQRGIPNYVITEFMSFNLGVNKQLPTDFDNLNKKAKDYIRTEVEIQMSTSVAKEKKASTPLKQQIESDLGVEIAKNIAGRFIDAKTGRFIKVDKKLMKSKFNKSPRLERNIVKGPAAKVKRKSVSISAAVSVAGTRPAKTTNRSRKHGKQQELLKVEQLINQRLPEKVRQNMGRPALINRTGRFADSVELLNLRETAAGVSGSYTYQLSPYETFENTGDRVWPTGYNPKPLIAKSIREIYYEYKQEQLVQLRRT